MAQLINEAKRFQKLAGLITESEYQSLKEKMSYDDFEQMIKPFLDLAKSKGWIWNSSGNSWVQITSPSIALYHKDTLPTTKEGEYKGQETPLEKDVVAKNQINTWPSSLESKNANVIMNPDYDDYGGAAYFSSRDKSTLDAIKSSLVTTMDVATDVKEVSSQFTSGKDFEPQKYFTMVLKKKEAKPQQESQLNEASWSQWWDMLHPAAIIAGSALAMVKLLTKSTINNIKADLKKQGKEIPDENTLKQLAIKAVTGEMDRVTGAGGSGDIQEENLEQVVNEALKRARKSK